MRNLFTCLFLILVVGATAQTVQEASIVAPQSNTFEVTWNVTPSASNMDGVVALAGGNATTWGELSAIVRCKPEGQFDARNGGEYAADAVINYEGGQTYGVRLVVDVFLQKYSVFITPPGGAETALATDYAFRAAADILMYKCIFINENAIAGSSLNVENFKFSLPAERLASPLGIEEIRYDAQCDTALAWEDLGLFESCPRWHEYTAYQGSITVDGDPTDADWATIPWTPFDVYENLKDPLDRSFMAWEMFDEYWDSWLDYSGWFKVLWNPDDGVMYYLFKEFDDVIVWPGDGFTDPYNPDVQQVNQWQGDTYEIEMFPMLKALVGTQVMDHIGNIFVVDGEVRFKPLTQQTDPEAALHLADGDAATSWDDTNGKAIAYVRDEDTGMNIFELAIKLKDGMEADSVWYFGFGKTEGDYEYDDGKNRESFFYWGAGKRKPGQWGSLMFSGDRAPATAVTEKIATQPKTSQLKANYPNPFNPSTTIPFTVDKVDHVTISVYNAIGQHIETLVNDVRAAGDYQVTWNGTHANGEKAASGIYFIRMTTGNSTFVQKALLVQ